MSQPYYPGEADYRSFPTYNPSTGASQNVDSGVPTAKIIRNGTYDTGVNVTVTNLETGIYNAAWTWPTTYALGDTVELQVNATVNSIASKMIVMSGRLNTNIRFPYGTVTTRTLTSAVLSGVFPQNLDYHNMPIKFDALNAAGGVGVVISNAGTVGGTISGGYGTTLAINFNSTGTLVDVGTMAIIGGARAT